MISHIFLRFLTPPLPFSPILLNRLMEQRHLLAQIPLHLSWWRHLWMTPTPILMITFLSLFEGIINSEVKYDNLNMHCHSGILLSINVTHHLTYQDFTTRTKHQNNYVQNSISKFFRQCTYLSFNFTLIMLIQPAASIVSNVVWITG